MWATPLTGIKDARWAGTMKAQIDRAGVGYTENTYLTTTRASTIELQRAPGAVAERLAGRPRPSLRRPA